LQFTAPGVEAVVDLAGMLCTGPLATAPGGDYDAAMQAPDSAILEGPYRYCLTRRWGSGARYAMFVGLNPSTATAKRDDATVRRCVAYARAWGFDGLWLANLFAYRSRDPMRLRLVRDPVGPRNDHYLQKMAEQAGIVVAAWGNHGSLRGRAKAVRAMLPRLHYLRLTKQGQPAHPLYLPRALRPHRWW